MSLTTTRTYFASMTGMPAMGANAGDLIAVYRACLVTGTANVAVTSVTVSNGICTVIRDTGFVTEPDCVVELSSCSLVALNDSWRVLTAGPYGFTFACPGVADGVYTGAAMIRHPGAGWTEEFTATNVAVFRCPDTTADRPYIRVDDTVQWYGLLRGYETMSDAFTGTGTFPSAGHLSSGCYFMKFYSGSNTLAWTVLANTKTAHSWVNYYNDSCVGHTFGRFNSTESNDPHCNLVMGCNWDQKSDPDIYTGNFAHSGSEGGFMQRDWLHVATSAPAYKASPVPRPVTCFSGTGPLSYPNGPNGCIMIDRINLFENGMLRGHLPGLYFLPQNVGVGGFVLRERIPEITLPSGGSARVLPALYRVGGVVYDASGEW